jgi:hypothetical protein
MKVKRLALGLSLAAAFLAFAVFAALSQQKQNEEPKKPVFRPSAPSGAALVPLSRRF